MPASFGHLEGYGSGYYTYMWSLVIAKDLFSAFDRGNMFDPAVAGRYRDRILAQGGQKGRRGPRGGLPRPALHVRRVRRLARRVAPRPRSPSEPDVVGPLAAPAGSCDHMPIHATAHAVQVSHCAYSRGRSPRTSAGPSAVASRSIPSGVDGRWPDTPSSGVTGPSAPSARPPCRYAGCSARPSPREPSWRTGGRRRCRGGPCRTAAGGGSRGSPRSSRRR